MAREFSRAFYHSGQWRRAQAYYMRKPVSTDFGVVPPMMCERCHSLGRLKPAKVVHHKVKLTPENIHDQSVTLNEANFMRLCQDCHAYMHSGHEAPRVTFDEYGNLVRKDA